MEKSEPYKRATILVVDEIAKKGKQFKFRYNERERRFPNQTRTSF